MHIPTNKLVDLNPRTTTYEFFGPPGALAVTILTPLTVYSLYYGCSEETGGCPPSLSLSQLTDRLSDPSTYRIFGIHKQRSYTSHGMLSVCSRGTSCLANGSKVQSYEMVEGSAIK